MPFIVAAAALLRGANYTLLIHDSYPEILIAARKLKPASAIVRCIDYLNRWLHKHTRKIIVVGRDMQELVIKKSEGFDTRVTLIPNWAETDDVKPRPKE